MAWNAVAAGKGGPAKGPGLGRDPRAPPGA